MRGRIASVVLAAVALAACGESDADKASAEVCEARDSINSEVQSLQKLTPQTVTTDAVRGSVDAIRGDLEQIGDARADLSDDLRKEVEAANEAFGAELREVASTILRSTSVEEAKARIETSADQLAEAYRTSLGSVGCES